MKVNWKSYRKLYQIAIVSVFILVLVSGSVFAESATIRMLIWEGYAPDAQVQEFKDLVKQKYNVDLSFEISFVATNDDFFPALRNNSVDLIAPSHNVPKDARYNLINSKMTIPINMANIPNYKNVIPALQNADYITEGGVVYGVPMIRGPYGLAYNTDIVKEAPTSWNILWDPQYKNNYTISGDFYEANVFVAGLASGLNGEDIYSFAKLNTPAIKAKIGQLASNTDKFWIGVDTADNLSGLALATTWGFALPELRARGENWKIADPSEGTTGWVDNWMISHTLKDNPSLKRIAEEWCDFVLSDKFQAEVVVRYLGSAPVTTSVASLLTPTEIAEFHVDDPDYFANNIILWKILDKRNRNGIKSLWEAVAPQ